MKLILITFLLITFGANCQELPPIQNFTPQEYNGENQNWAISQSPEKIIYVANSKGLLEFNGASWKLYPSPNETIMRSVKVVDDRIYTGCFMEFGYWQKNDFGTLNYTSLSKQHRVKLIEDEEFWNIINIDDYIVFQSLRRIYIVNVTNGSLNTIDSESAITKMFKVDEEIYFHRTGKGIFKIESGKDFLVFDDSIVKNDEIINIFKRDTELLFLSKNNGFYLLKEGSMVEAKNFPNKFLSDISLYDAIQLNDNSFALGSISNGLLYLNPDGELQYQINQDGGLANNTILSIFEDVTNTLWLGLDYGVSYINLESPYRVYNDIEGMLGSVYASAIYEGKLYLGTNQGLFYRDMGYNLGFEFINDTQGQVWCLKEFDGKLICGHHSGTFHIKGDQATKIADIRGTWNVAKIGDKPNVLLQGNYDGLYVLNKAGDSWQLKNKIKGFNNSSRYFESLGNRIFVNHEYNGVFELEVDDALMEVQRFRKDTLLKGANSGIVAYNGTLIYAYKRGIFQYSENNRSFFKEKALSEVYNEAEYESGKLVADQEDNKLWIFNKSNISFIEPAGLSNALKIKKVPLTKEMRNGILGYENIIKLNDEGTYLVGKTSGYITIDINEIESKDFSVHIGAIENFNGTNATLLKKKSKGNFTNTENHFKFSFYVPVFDKYLTTLYQYRLKGIYNVWSDWSEKNEVTYENVPYGEYVFQVRAKIGNDSSNNTAEYSFKIAKPWYISDVMIALFVLGVLLFSIFMHTMYKQYYKRQRLKLMEKNTRELQLTEVKNEKEIIKIKNEKLEIENKSKKKELAASTMNIIKKNELLTKIKNQLQKVEDGDGINKVINEIDRNLNKNDDWEMFKEAFNNSDREFLKKIKLMHPELSPNDLKLCAYLRLNLSSKEIAQLLNITLKSVEIKRYRLRKKLDLQREVNLVNYILEL